MNKIIKVFKLENYGVISISGKDHLKTLQNLSTTNITMFAMNDNYVASSTCFLDTNGQLITDARIVKPIITKNKEVGLKKEEFYVVLQKQAISRFLAHLKKYSFIKQIELYDLTENFILFQLDVV